MPPEDPDAIAAQVIELLDDAELRRNVGAAARHIGDYFLTGRMLDELEEIYFGRLSGWRPLPFSQGSRAGAPAMGNGAIGNGAMGNEAIGSEAIAGRAAEL